MEKTTGLQEQCRGLNQDKTMDKGSLSSGRNLQKEEQFQALQNYYRNAIKHTPTSDSHSCALR